MESWDRGVLSNPEMRSTGGRVVYVLFFIALAVLAVTVVFPFLFAFTSSLKSSTEIYKSGL